MGTGRKQLPEKLIRTWFSGFFNLGMRQNLCRFDKGHDPVRQLAYRDIFPCGIYCAALLYASKIKRHFQINLRAH